MNFRFPLAILFLVVIVFQSCTNKSKYPGSIYDHQKKPLKYDLFSGEDETRNKDKALSWEEAYQKSKIVLLINSLEEFIKSKDRSENPFYIYRIKNGRTEKTENNGKIEFPLYFLSETKLPLPKNQTDSLYIFLIPIKEYKILKSDLPLQYKWLDNSPINYKNN